MFFRSRAAERQRCTQTTSILELNESRRILNHVTKRINDNEVMNANYRNSIRQEKQAASQRFVYGPKGGLPIGVGEKWSQTTVK